MAANDPPCDERGGSRPFYTLDAADVPLPADPGGRRFI
jgi:hypothetical protein